MAKSPKRKEYLKDYKQGADGKYTYSGKTYSFDGNESERKRTYIILVALVLVLLAGIVGSGCIDAAGANGAYYVIIPLIGEVSAFFALAWNLSKLLFEGEKIRGYIFEIANNRIPPAALIIMFFALFGLAASVLYLIFHGFEGKMLKAILYVISKGFNAALAFIVKKYYNSINWKVV